MDADSAERGRSENGVVGGDGRAGSLVMYRMNRAEISAWDAGVPHSLSAFAAYSNQCLRRYALWVTHSSFQATSPAVNLAVGWTPHIGKSAIGKLIPTIFGGVVLTSSADRWSRRCKRLGGILR